MTIDYSLLADMPLETLVSTEAGQQILGQLIAAENLEAEVNQHLDLLDVPEALRRAVTEAANAKRASMAERDTDAQLLFTDKEPGLNLSMSSVKSKVQIDVASVGPVSSGPHIG